jgi:NAD(P)-dependent dehydrogenase (short-subunit alcohol dehydrogenase family)
MCSGLHAGGGAPAISGQPLLSLLPYPHPPACGRLDSNPTPAPNPTCSKLANIMFTYELARRLASDPSNPTVNALHPGVVRTELGRYMVTDDR